jgi:hypothetical protein
MSAKDFEQHFLDFLEPQLLYELQEKLKQDAGATYPNAQQNRGFTDADREPFQISAKEEQELTALIYFLANGMYPWWYKKSFQKTPSRLLEDLTAHDRETLILKILSIKRQGREEEAERMIRRIFIHLSREKNGDFIYHVLALYNNQALTENIEALVKNRHELMKTFALADTDFYSRLFQFLISEQVEDETNIIRRFLVQIKDEKTTDRDKNAGEKKTNRKRQPHTEAETGGIFITNAGLVLLHPFLPVLFEELGLLNTLKQFVSEDAQQKAAVLLYYLQCGDHQYREWEMTLNKIICGIVPHEPIPDGIMITEKEKEECRLLLLTMVNYWDALKGASPEAVQNTFILREGKITWKEDFWLIQVERTGADILLDRLPWGFGTIKFPWLDQIIYTEW